MIGGGKGQQFGRWTVQGQLGAGGMGVVYDAIDADGRRAALKVISPAFAADVTFRARFRREIDVSKRVSGPRVASVLDADPDGEPPWLASEYVDGPTLAEAVDRTGRLADRPLTSLATALIEALQEIHGAGVVHRDLKPSNVMLTAATPKIIDFGIASAAEATSITMTGSLLGSAGWMSPEQVSGEHVDAASDIFAWGALIAFAGTGRPPFGTGRAEALAYRVVHDEPDVDGVPNYLTPLIERAMHKEPSERASLRVLLRELVGDADPAVTVTQGWSSVPATVVAPVRRTTAIDQSTALGSPGPDEAGDERRTGRRWLWSAAVAGVVAVAIAVTLIGLGQRDGREGLDASATVPVTEPDETSTSTSALTTTTTTAPPTTTTTQPPPPSTTDPRNYYTTDGTAPVLSPECLGMLSICYGDTLETVTARFGPESSRNGYVDEFGQAVVTRVWELGDAVLIVTFDVVDTVTTIDVGGSASGLRFVAPDSIDVHFGQLTIGDVRRQLGEPERMEISGEGMTIYFYGYRRGGEGFLSLLFSHTATWDDDPGFGPALDERLVDSVEITDSPPT